MIGVLIVVLLILNILAFIETVIRISELIKLKGD